MRFLATTTLLLLLHLAIHLPTQAQINLRKLKDKAKKKAEELLKGEDEKPKPNDPDSPVLDESKPPAANVTAEWAKKYYLAYATEESDLEVRVGDIDNLGFGWPSNYNPFSGEDTPSHRYPWKIDPADPQGTDRIMVISSYEPEVKRPPRGRDGYTGNTKRPHNNVQPLTLEFDPKEIEIKSALIQMFVDDFQSPVFGSRYQVRLDNQRTPYIEPLINALRQTGPIGKMITFNILPEYLPLLEDGKLQILIDDQTTGAGDGCAIDFVRLLINPKILPFTGNLSGTVLNKKTGKPLPGAVVSASEYIQTLTDAQGNFTLKNVPAGLVTLKGYKSGFKDEVDVFDLITGTQQNRTLRLEPLEQESTEAFQQSLDKTGKIVLYGIYFDSGQSTLKPESIHTLNQVLELIQNNSDKKFRISGHTDSDGTDTANQTLSENRATAVLEWLNEKGVTTGRLQSKGYGESNPVANNATDEGKALNRRVEIEVIP